HHVGGSPCRKRDDESYRACRIGLLRCMCRLSHCKCTCDPQARFDHFHAFDSPRCERNDVTAQSAMAYSSRPIAASASGRRAVSQSARSPLFLGTSHIGGRMETQKEVLFETRGQCALITM